MKGIEKLKKDLVIALPAIRGIIPEMQDEDLVKIIKALPDRLSYIFSAYYFEREPCSKIATDLRLSRNYVMNQKRWELKKIAGRIKAKAAKLDG